MDLETDGLAHADSHLHAVARVPVVAARHPFPASYYRRARQLEWVRDRFWVIPSLCLAGGLLLAVLTTRSGAPGLPAWLATGLPIDPGTADSVLGIIATSMLTFLGVVFTITLVALQLASAQVSPRVIRTFVRSGVTKAAFGIFLATFAFALAALVLDETNDKVAAQSRSVTVAFVLVGASMVVFLAYVTATMKLLQVVWVVTAVADESRHAIAAAYPPRSGYTPADEFALTGHAELVRLPETGRRSLGVILGIQVRGLVDLARRHDWVIELVPQVGTYVTTGGLVFAVYPRATVLEPVRDPGELVRLIDLGRGRTLYQDPAYGIRQLVDVAVQALSPALNQPTTATVVIDRLEDLVGRIMHRPQPTGVYVDDTGTARLVVPTPSWEDVLDLAFHEIGLFGAGSPQVTRRLLAAYGTLLDTAPPDRRPALRARRDALVGLVSGDLPAGAAHIGTRPDPLGLG